MPHYEARLSSKGQLTIPSEVRTRLDLKEGDRVDFYLEPQSSVVRLVARNKGLADLKGIVRVPPGQKIALSDGDIDKAIGEYLTEKHERIEREWREYQEFKEWKRSGSVKAAE